MENKHIALIILSVIAFFFIVRSAFFEQRMVSDKQWNKNYDYDSEEPYGASIFYQMLEIVISTGGYLNHKKQEEVIDFISKGNNALIISSQYQTPLNAKDTTGIRSTSYSKHDSILNFKFVDFNDSLSYKNYFQSGNKASDFYFRSFNVIHEDFYTSLADENSSSSIFFKSKLDTGVVYRHVLPELFANVASVQDFYLPHFAATFSYLEGEKIIIDHPSFDDSYEDNPNESYLEYILGSRPLKWAYYCFLLTTIGFLFFRGKRKQRVIPIPEKNENTSIQYVDTLSDLFEMQGQNEKLVPHLENVFLHRVKQKYYLAPDNERFIELLSKKSRIPENQIEAILKYLKNGKGIYEFSDDQLIMLYKRLEDFYNNAE